MDDGKPTIAIVDDDPRVVESLSDLLESAGYAVLGFQSARALLETDVAAVDALITDIGMPGIDGFDLRDRIIREHPDLPVFMITGRHELAERGRAQNVRGFFRKPFNAQALLAAVAEALGTPTEESKDER